jgi:hypothetical protein
LGGIVSASKARTVVIAAVAIALAGAAVGAVHWTSDSAPSHLKADVVSETLHSPGHPGALVNPAKLPAHASAAEAGSAEGPGEDEDAAEFEGGDPDGLPAASHSDSGPSGATSRFPKPQSVRPNSASLGVNYRHGSTQTSSKTPPDGSIAVGPSDVIVATNQQVTIRDKTGHLEKTFTLQGFFSTPSGKPPVDPNVLYDPALNRYWLSAQNNDFGPGGTTTNAARVLVALSDTSDPTSTWHVFTNIDLSFFQGAHHEDWCDYDKIALDAQALYIACNMSTDAGASFVTSEVRVILKSEFTSGAVTDQFILTNFHDQSAPNGLARTLLPVSMIDATKAQGEYLVSADSAGGTDNAFSLWKITNAARCCDGDSSTSPTLQVVSVPGRTFAPAPPARQPGGVTPITIGPTKVMTPFWRNNSLQFGQTLKCTWTGGATSSCVRFVQWNVGSFPTVTSTNDWVLGSAGTDTYVPAMAPASDGWKTMVFDRSSPTENVSVHFVAIPPPAVCTQCVSGPVKTLHAGGSPYVFIDTAGRNRWGDYFGAASDPDGTHVWIEGEYPAASTSNPSSTFGTWAGQTTPH